MDSPAFRIRKQIGPLSSQFYKPGNTRLPSSKIELAYVVSDAVLIRERCLKTCSSNTLVLTFNSCKVAIVMSGMLSKPIPGCLSLNMGLTGVHEDIPLDEEVAYVPTPHQRQDRVDCQGVGWVSKSRAMSSSVSYTPVSSFQRVILLNSGFDY